MKTPNEVVQFFAYIHLPEDLQTVSKPFYSLAFDIVTNIPYSEERTIALRKLWDAKNYAVWCVASGKSDE